MSWLFPGESRGPELNQDFAGIRMPPRIAVAVQKANLIRRKQPMIDQGITARASIRLLSAAEGGRATSIRGSYRPNHNFFGADSRNMTVGFIDLPNGAELHPGESVELEITFWKWPGLEEQIYRGREWRIQEGARLVGIGTILEVVPAAE